MNDLEGDELLKAYLIADKVIGSIMFLIRHRIPFEDWPADLQGICWVNEDFLGPAEDTKMKKDLDYYINLNWSLILSEDNPTGDPPFILKVKELPGVCSDGDTLDEAIDGIHEALEGAIRLYIKNGEEIPEPKR